MFKLTVQLVTWNGGKYIPFLFESLRKQSFTDWKLIILDNGSTDNTVSEIKMQILDFPVEVELIEGGDNLGFAKGHNTLVKSQKSPPKADPPLAEKVKSQYILLVNQDMYLEKDCLEKLVKFMDENEEASVVSPRLMRWDFVEQKFTNKIDTLGLSVSRSRRVTEIATGQDFSNFKFQISNFTEVFGVSGALPLFRKTAIDRAGLFDESFGSYKEDVDLAFRLRSAGYKAFILLDTVAYHDRTAVGTEKLSVKNKKSQSDFVRYYSYRNHLLTLLKNEYLQNFLLDLPLILWYELRKFFFFLLFDRKVLRGLGDIVKMRPAISHQRSVIKNSREVGWREIRKWFH